MNGWIGCVWETNDNFVLYSSVAPKKCSDADDSDWMRAQAHENFQQISTLIEWKHFDHTHASRMNTPNAICHWLGFRVCYSVRLLLFVLCIRLIYSHSINPTLSISVVFDDTIAVEYLSPRAIGINIIFKCTCAFHRIVWNKNNEKKKKRREDTMKWMCIEMFASGNKLGLANVTHREQFTIVFLLFIRSTLSTRELLASIIVYF